MITEAGLEASAAVMQLMEAATSVERRSIIRDNLEVLGAGLEPFLEGVVTAAPEEDLKTQARLNGILFSSEVARELAVAGHRDDAEQLVRQELEWVRQTLPVLTEERGEDLARFTAELCLIHAEEYRRLGLLDGASQSLLLVAPIFEALEIVEQQLAGRRLSGEALLRVMTALLTLEKVAFEDARQRLDASFRELDVSPAEVEAHWEEARQRTLAHWRRLPAPHRLDGLNPDRAFPFRSVKIARAWVEGLRCSCCDGKSALIEESVVTLGTGRRLLTFRLRCESSCGASPIYYNELPSASLVRLGSELPASGKGGEQGELTTREYIDLLRSLSPYPLAEDNVIEGACREALAAVREAAPVVLPDSGAEDIQVEVGLIPGLLGRETSPFSRRCRDGFAIIVPEIFVIRLSRFARHLSQIWGISDGTARVAAPALGGEHASALTQMLSGEFWEVRLSSTPTEVPEQMGPLLVAILENCLTFVIAHELAHVYLGHAGRHHYISLEDQGTEVLLLTYRQQDEVAADKLACRLGRKVAERQSQHEVLEIFSTASVDVLFTLLTLIEDTFPADPRQHPPAHVRRAALRSQVGDGISGPSLQFAVGAQLSLESHFEGRPDLPELPDELRGNWQNFEQAVRSSALGEADASLTHLARFLIQQPDENEGWRLLRHLLLADRPNEAMLSPRGAILTFPEIRDDGVIIRVDESLTDPAGTREVERKVWMKYAEDLLEAAAPVGGFDGVSFQDEVDALRHFLLRCAYVPGLDRSEGSVDHLLDLEDRGLLPVFAYFARFGSFDRPGFTEFRDRLLADTSPARELFRALVVVSKEST